MLSPRLIPWILVALRVLLAPAILLMAIHHRQGVPMAVAIIAALLSDIYDGIIARRLRVETTALRRADSVADTIFYAAAAWSAWLLAPAAVRSVRNILGFLLALEVFRYAFDYAKFRREASYHSYGAKLWGLVLALALILLLAFNISGWILRTAIWVGIISDMEGLAISIVLPAWSHDIRSIAHALRARRRVLAAGAGNVLES
jgi:CDP-diacylglycerol--glycerol-3-phosphate 3-phosphatidyltransferase